MKNLILIISVLIVDARATTPTVESVAGTYKLKVGEDTYRTVLLENGVLEDYDNGKKVGEHEWKITDDEELHFIFEYSEIWVFRINKNGSITSIAIIGEDGKREDDPKEFQITYKKIK